jgi:hypothetical protein
MGRAGEPPRPFAFEARNTAHDLMERPPAATITTLAWSTTRPKINVWLRTPWTIAASVVSSVTLAFLLYFSFQRAALAEILTLWSTAKPGPDYWLLPASVITTTLLLLAPGVLLGIPLVLLGRPRAGKRTFIGMSSALVAMVLVDLELMRSVGRHLSEITELALQPNTHVAAGNAWGWTWLVLTKVGVAIFGTVMISSACGVLTAHVERRLSRLLRRVIGTGGLVALVMCSPAPMFLLAAWGNHPLVERLYGNSVVDIRPGFGLNEASTPRDPRLADLHTRMRKSYKAAYAAITGGKPGDDSAISIPGRPPNVILIVTESFRHDAFGPELMPRLSHWAEAGLVSTHHDAGSVYSQSGAFALLYGRSPAEYHQTLDAKVPPQFCATLRRSGYECAYFSGHPKVWLRREEFLNDQTMDHFVHDDRGTWPEWDTRALDNMVELVGGSEKPVFAMVLLMSSHFEYQYPPKYEVDLPVSDSRWKVTAVQDLGPDAATPHRNRYRNTMRFIDDAVADAIARLDPTKNLVIFTGDHGESIYDDGHYTHGYSFAEVLTRTPFAMVGPGVSPARLSEPTSHVDVLPSVLHSLTGRQQHLQHLHGIDWFAGERRTSRLFTHSLPYQPMVQALLDVQGKRLRFDIDLGRPAITLLGFEDELAHLLPVPELTADDVTTIAQAFDEHLTLLRQ